MNFFGKFAVLIATVAARILNAQPLSQPIPEFWRTDGPVYAMAATNGILYLGGMFTYIGPATGPVGLMDVQSGNRLPGSQKFSGAIRSMIADGFGGWYIGGAFTVEGYPGLQNLVHVLEDASVDTSFRPILDGTVRSLSLTGDTLLVGGEFSQVNHEQWAFLAALDATTAMLKEKQVRVDAPVSVIICDGEVAYVGGRFNQAISADGFTYERHGLVAAKPATGEVLPWFAQCLGGDEGVKAILISSNAVYIAGDFTSCGAKPRHAIASVEKETGAVTSWSPNPQSWWGGYVTVNALALSGNVIYAGGQFTSIGGQERYGLAALEADGLGQADAKWQADSDGRITAMQTMGADILVAGSFTSIGGEIDYANAQHYGGIARQGIARIDRSNGAIEDWGAQVSSLNMQSAATVWALASDGTRWAFGGDFQSCGGLVRSFAAALKLATGGATEWNPGVDLPVRALALGPNCVYIGGDFVRVRGQIREGIARVSLDTGAVDAWDAHMEGVQYPSATHVGAIALTPDSIVLGGQFQKIGGTNRQNLVEVRADTALPTLWAPDPNGPVNAVLCRNGAIYAGGEFNWICGQQKKYLALVGFGSNREARLDTGFEAGLNSQVSCLAAQTNRLFVGGAFSLIGELPGVAVGVIDVATGRRVSAFDAQIAVNYWTQPFARALFAVNNTIYVGGVFTGLGRENRLSIGSVDTSVGLATTWDPGVNGAVCAIAVADDTIVIGGEFTQIGLHGMNPPEGQFWPYLAAFRASPRIVELRHTTAGGVSFEIMDGDGSGDSILIQATASLADPHWETARQLDVCGRQRGFEDPARTNGENRFYRLVRQ